MSTQDDISRIAVENYSSSTPWPDEDAWHKYTYLGILCKSNNFILSVIQYVEKHTPFFMNMILRIPDIVLYLISIRK